MGERSEAYKAARAVILVQPCRCVACHTCNGHGSICVEMVTGKYIGPTPYDDLYDLARCDECDGGIIEVCDRCRELDELEEAFSE